MNQLIVGANDPRTSPRYATECTRGSTRSTERTYWPIVGANDPRTSPRYATECTRGSTRPTECTRWPDTFNVNGGRLLQSVGAHSNYYSASWQIVAAQLVSSFSCSGANCYITLEPLLSRLLALSPEPPLGESILCRLPVSPGPATKSDGFPREPIHVPSK
jgi:hypothetical protein